MTYLQPLPPGSPPPSKLDPLEISFDHARDEAFWARQTTLSSAQVFRHSGWAPQRARIYAAFSRTHQDFNRRSRFQYCGTHARVLQKIDPPYDYKIVGDYCRDRFCLPCSKLRGHTIAANVIKQLDGRPARFLTLTLRSQTEPLVDLLNRIQQCFRSLRAKPFWKTKVDGGVSFIECKWNPQANRWHVHLHMLLEGRYLDKPTLEAQWLAITADSYVCDLQLCRSETDAARYVTKYVTKAFSADLLSTPDRLDEAVRSFRGRRLFTTFGSWRGVPLLATDRDDTWIDLGELLDILAQAKAGDPDAMKILNSIDPDATATALRLMQPRPPPIGHRTLDPTPRPQQTFSFTPAIAVR